MFITDTHTHLFSEEFKDDRDALINAAISKGVKRFFLPNIDTATIPAMLEVCQAYPQNCFPMIGLHPCSVLPDYKDQLEEIRSWLNKETFYAIGEIGIDLFWDKTLREQQTQAFIQQIEMAVERDLPVVIHSRESFDVIIEVIRETYKKNNWPEKKLRGIFHCFTGSVADAQVAIDLGFYLGIGGVVTFKNSGMDKVVKELPLESLVLETDAPYLAPAPNRGKRNIPEYILLVAEKVSDLKNLPIEEIAVITSSNASKLFRLA